MATQTANGKYDYNKKYHGLELEKWVQLVHKDISDASKWKYFLLKKGAFGFDCQTVSIGHTLDNIKDDYTEDQVASLVHDGWIINYCYWRDNEPWKKYPNIYFPPASNLGDSRRDECAKTQYKDLTEDEKIKDLIIARSILAILN